jgi:dihydroxyacetone kinase
MFNSYCGAESRRTVGAIFSIFLAGLTTQVRDFASSGQTKDIPWAQLADGALETLQVSTKARVGHRTVMDALIPFVAELKASGDLAKAVQATSKAAENTSRMAAKMGRAAYVGELAEGTMPPDPGAMAFAEIVKGLLKGSAV